MPTSIETLTGDDVDARLLVDELFAALPAYFLFTRSLTRSGALTLVIRGGRFKTNDVADAILTLGASTTTYVQANATTGAISSNTTGYTSGAIAIGVAVTNDEGLVTNGWRQDFTVASTPVP